jgi:hypothetical protein
MLIKMIHRHLPATPAATPHCLAARARGHPSFTGDRFGAPTIAPVLRVRTRFIHGWPTGTPALSALPAVANP